MESPRIFGGGRALLPHETQLCDALGITEEEYWQFVYLIESVNGKRSKAYDLIPNIVNMPPVAIAPLTIFGVGIGFYGVVAIGVALSYVSAALTPKPRAPKTPPSLLTEGAASAKRFAPQTGFNSVQELADLGEVIPLVFTKREEIEFNNNIKLFTGGTRVNSRLVWSQLLSKGTHQQLKACFVLSSGQITTPPDFSGYAIGDLLLKNYTNAKIAVYYNGGVAPDKGSEDRNVSQDDEENSNYGENRLKQSNKYDEGILVPEKDRNGAEMVDDIFSVDSDYTEGPSNKVFSGVRSPSTQTKFGTFCPMPNQMRFQVPYELVLKPKDTKTGDDIDVKRRKIATYFPRYAGFMRVNGVEPAEDVNRVQLQIGDKVQYTIGDMDPETNLGSFDPWGKEDVRNSVDSDRERIDDNIALGESYMIGNCFGVCVEIPQQGLWERGNYKDFIFEITDLGSGDHSIDIRTGVEGLQMAHSPDQLNILQRSAIATVSNNRNCDTTEIGFKSTVYKQITGFPNVNSHPGGYSYANPKGTLNSYQDENGNISLGGMNKYCTRYSFFRLQARKAGTDDAFETIDDGKPFVIKGRTPQPQYNFIRINHPLGQYEFRFQPYNGNDIIRFYLNNDRAIVRLLKDNCELQADTFESEITGLIYQFRYSGLNINLNKSDVCNTEFFLGKIIDTRHTVSGLSQTSQGVIPLEGGFKYALKETQYITRTDDFDNRSYVYYSGYRGKYLYYWKGELIGESEGFPPVLQYDDTTQFRGSTIQARGWRYSYRQIERYTLESGPAEPVATFDDIELTGGETDIPNFPHNKAKVQIKLYDNDVAAWTVTDGGGPYRKGTKLNIPSVSGGGKTFSGLSDVVPVLGLDKDFPVEVLDDDGDEAVTGITNIWPGGSSEGSAHIHSRNLRPLDAVADFISYEAEVPSHMENPEHEIVYVNEMISNTPMPYSNLAMGGIRLNSSKEFASFTQFSAYFKEGISVKRLIDGGVGPTNLFPEITFALLTDPQIGAGDLIGVKSVDEERMTIAAKFCRANRLFWDGVIVDEKNLREFIFQIAAYCLLDFTILGGRFALYPSVPFDENFKIDPNQKIQIKALFTDGNIKNLKASFLSPEERQNFQGFATYRKEKLNGFAEPKTLGLRVKDAKDEDPREGFDMSLFCTSFEHASTFLKYALKTRELVDHGVSFQTTPQSAMHLAPGDYIRLHSEATHTSRFANGVITEEGVIQSQKEITNGTQIIFWKPGDSDVSEPTAIEINNNLAASKFRGCVFTVPDTSITDRVYKVESMTYAEDGLIEISGSHTPLTANKTLAILDYYNDNNEPSFHTIRD